MESVIGSFRIHRRGIPLLRWLRRVAQNERDCGNWQLLRTPWGTEPLTNVQLADIDVVELDGMIGAIEHALSPSLTAPEGKGVGGGSFESRLPPRLHR
jgi:hypothetical protein